VRAAQNNLGFCYQCGEGVEQDAKEAARLFRLSAGQGFSAAQLNLGMCYFNGKGVEQNDGEALRLFRLGGSPRFGVPNGANLIETFYREGRVVPKDNLMAACMCMVATLRGLDITMRLRRLNLSPVFHAALCAVRCALCAVRCALCAVRCALCAVRCALCAVRCAEACRMRRFCSLRCASPTSLQKIIQSKLLLIGCARSILLR
jgi:hypothetical protein